MMSLTREEILATKDYDIEEVYVPEWGGDVCVRGMTGRERDLLEQRFTQSAKKNAPVENLRALLVGMCVVDESGKRVFSDSDIESLGKKSAIALDRVFAVAQRLSGIGVEAQGELEKNSEGGPSVDSASDLRSA